MSAQYVEIPANIRHGKSCDLFSRSVKSAIRPGDNGMRVGTDFERWSNFLYRSSPLHWGVKFMNMGEERAIFFRKPGKSKNFGRRITNEHLVVQQAAGNQD